VRGFLKRACEGPLIVAAALLFLFEDVLWAWLNAAVARLARLRVWAWLEARVARLPPYPAMALFLVPVIILFPAHLLAVYLAAIGRFGAALLVYVVVKVVGTAMLARLFTLCRPALLRLHWFAVLYAWVVRTKGRLYAHLDALPAWRRTRERLHALKGSLRLVWRRFRGRPSRAVGRIAALRRRWGRRTGTP
jgi:hypothetical protein